MIKKSLAVLLPLAILAGGWYFLNSQSKDSLNTNSKPEPSITAAVKNDTYNPLAVIPESDADVIVKDIQTSSTPSSNQATTNTDDIDVTAIATAQPLSDEEFERLEKLLLTDRNLRLEILEEFRYNIDPERAKQLAALLGSHSDPEIVQTASELAYSGDPQSRVAGLDLLSRLQPHSDQARDIAIDLLSSEVDPAFLVSTMNVLATPARAANESQKQLLTDNLNSLYNHQDARVRAHSISLMGRWDKNSPASRETLTRGLSDSDKTVRSRATFAIKNIQNPDDNIINGLLAIAENTNEGKSTRYEALDALADMSLSGISMRRYNISRRNISRRSVSSQTEN